VTSEPAAAAVEPAPPPPPRKIKPIKVALTDADLILQQAQQTAKEIAAAARQQAADTQTAAELLAREIVDRARTVAAALDPASEHQPRVRPPELER
jgi:hypothetical protein